MKKITFFLILFCFFTLQAQTTNWDTALSQIYTPTSGFSPRKILLDRAPIFADLYNFNNTDHNTSSADHFKQALLELNTASNNQYFTNYSVFPNFTSEIKTATSIPIGIISTQCSYLNYDEENNTNGNLKLVNGIFTPINTSVANFIEKDLLLISPLFPAYTSDTDNFIFHINAQQWHQYANTIKKLEANFGDGVYHTIIDNSVAVSSGLSVNIPIPVNTVKKQEITFRATFTNNVEKITKSTIALSKRNNASIASKSGVCGVSTLLKHRSTIADTQGVKGELEYKVFYGDSNTTCTVRKPIIIVDGFDPGDKRRIDFQDCQNDARCLQANPNASQENYNSIEKLMRYDNGTLVKPSLIDKLTLENFDVILVNFPYYYKQQFYAPSGEICAGADDITRNGKTVASFIQKLNADLLAVGSTEKLVVMGPSMGGLITRYALAYLEKNNINTNTKLWVSMDSPHQGANIPIAVQEDIYFLGKKLKNTSAEKQFDELLHSKAADQMLIDIVDYNGNAVKNQNSIAFLNELKSNGIANSNGYPILNVIKKISVTNGSLLGNYNVTPNQTFLDVTASVRIKLLGIRVGRKRIFQIQNKFMPNFNQTSLLVSNLGRNPDQNIGETNYSVTINSWWNTNGSMDAVPGGTNNSANDLKDEVVNSLNNQNAWSNQFISIITTASNLIVNLNTPNPNSVINPQAFIPMHSSLETSGFSDWYQPINKNISCSGQTKFDSFYGEDYNMEHVTFSNNMVNWLMKNIKDGLQAPYFPISTTLNGPESICENTNTTYSFTDICKLPSSATWSVDGNLEIVGSTGTSVTVKGLYSGNAVITATFSNGQTLSKKIWVGLPSFPKMLTYSNIPYSSTMLPFNYYNAAWSFASSNSEDRTEKFVFTDLQGNLIIKKTISNGQAIITPQELGISYGQTRSFYVQPYNACGTPTKKLKFTVYMPTECEFGIGCMMERFYSVSPNPTSDNITIDLKDKTKKPKSNTHKTAKLYDNLGNQKADITIMDDKAIISINNLPTGVYHLKIKVDNEMESHTIIKK